MTVPEVTVTHVAGRRHTQKPPLHLVKPNWFVDAAGRFDRPDSAWIAALRYYITQGIAVTGTEAAGRAPALFKQALGDSGWDFAHLDGAAAGECYGAWDGSVLYAVEKPWAYKLTDLTWVRSPEYGGKEAAKVHALVLPLARRRGRSFTVFVVVHMPLDNTGPRAEAWLDCCRGLERLQGVLERRYPHADVVFVGDWNKNLRLPTEAGMVRQHLEKPLGLIHSWTHGLPRGGGTDGHQVIDFALVPRPMLAACELLKDLPDSDHRAFRYRLRRGKRAF